MSSLQEPSSLGETHADNISGTCSGSWAVHGYLAESYDSGRGLATLGSGLFNCSDGTLTASLPYQHSLCVGGSAMPLNLGARV